MNQLALVLVHVSPIGPVALLVAVVALAHEKEIGGEINDLARIELRGRNGPEIVCAGPRGLVDAVAVADVLRQIVLLDHFTDVRQDLLGRGDGWSGPGLEAIAEGVKIAIGADTGIFV